MGKLDALWMLFLLNIHCPFLDKVQNRTELADYDGIEILEDNPFREGVFLCPVNIDVVKKNGFARTYVDTLDFGNPVTQPVWRVAQWHSRYELADIQWKRGDEGRIEYGNGAKKIALYPDSSLLLELNGSWEYENARRKGERWPHLLIEQDFRNVSLSIGLAERIVFAMDIMLVKCENKMTEKTFDPSLHTAHSPFFFVVKNDNECSKDYNQRIWFGIPSYDYRYVSLSEEEKTMWDTGTNTYIYKIPPRSFWGDVNLHDKQWHKGSVDLKPFLSKALLAMREKGVFVNTKLDDLKISGMNFGLEVPGTFDVAVRVKRISLRYF